MTTIRRGSTITQSTVSAAGRRPSAAILYGAQRPSVVSLYGGKMPSKAPPMTEEETVIEEEEEYNEEAAGKLSDINLDMFSEDRREGKERLLIINS